MTLDKAWIPAAALVMGIFHEVSEKAWDELWEIIIRETTSAETMFTAGEGAKKKAYVLGAIDAFLVSKTKLGPVIRTIIRIVLGKAIDAVVAELNEFFGHGWSDFIHNAKDGAERFFGIFQGVPASPSK